MRWKELMVESRALCLLSACILHFFLNPIKVLRNVWNRSSKDRNESVRLWTWITLLSVHLISTIDYLSMLYVSHCDIEIPCVGTVTEVE